MRGENESPGSKKLQFVKDRSQNTASYVQKLGPAQTAYGPVVFVVASSSVGQKGCTIGSGGEVIKAVREINLSEWLPLGLSRGNSGLRGTLSA